MILANSEEDKLENVRLGVRRNEETKAEGNGQNE